ncbi:hypothetical protein Q5752_002569 [Cryptotrichosporon argae]
MPPRSVYHRLTSPAPGVALLEFNRPAVNAFNDEMWQELRALVEHVSADPDVRALVVASALDTVFTAGLDLTAQTALLAPHVDPARRAFALRDHLLDFQAAISAFETCRQPVIAAMHGTAVGLAVDLASACDVRLAAADATFGIVEVNVGLAADIGTLQRFPKVVGHGSRARELALTGRPFDAAEAYELGFVSAVVPGGRAEVIQRAVEMAAVIASKSPVAVAGTKHLLNHARDHSVAEGLEYTATWNMAMLQADDTEAAMRATLTKRPATFEPLSRRAKL